MASLLFPSSHRSSSNADRSTIDSHDTKPWKKGIFGRGRQTGELPDQQARYGTAGDVPVAVGLASQSTTNGTQSGEQSPSTHETKRKVIAEQASRDEGAATGDHDPVYLHQCEIAALVPREGSSYHPKSHPDDAQNGRAGAGTTDLTVRSSRQSSALAGEASQAGPDKRNHASRPNPTPLELWFKRSLFEGYHKTVPRATGKNKIRIQDEAAGYFFGKTENLIGQVIQQFEIEYDNHLMAQRREIETAYRDELRTQAEALVTAGENMPEFQDRNYTILELEEELKVKDAQIMQLRNENAENKRIAESRKQALETKDDMLQSMWENNKDTQTKANENHQGEISVHKQKIQALEADLSRSKEEQSEEHNSAIEKLSKDHQAELVRSVQEVKHSYDVILIERTNTHQKEAQNLKDTIRRERNNHDLNMSARKREYERLEGQHATLRDDHENLLFEHAELKDQRQQDLESFESQLLQQRREAEEERTLNLSERFKAIETLNNEHREQLFRSADDYKRQLNEQIAAIEAQAIDSSQSLVSKHRLEVEELQNTHSNAISHIFNELKEKKRILEVTEQELQSMKEFSVKLEGDLESTKQDLKKTKATLESKEKALDMANKSHIEAVKGLDQAHTAEKKDLVQAHAAEKKNLVQASQLKENQLKQTHITETEDLVQAHRRRERQSKEKREADRKNFQDQLRELSESLLARDQNMSVGAMFSPSQLPRKSDDKLKAEFLIVQRMVEEISESWEAWKPEQKLWTKEIMSKASSEHGDRVSKQAVLQDIMWKQLFQFIFGSPFRVFGEEGQNLDTEWVQQCGGTVTNQDDIGYRWPPLGVKAERWRYMTMLGCRDALKTKVSKLDPRSGLKLGYGNRTDNLIEKLKEEIGAIVDLSDDKKKIIKELVTKSARMWLDFEVHRCRIVILLAGPASRSSEDTIAMIRNGKFCLTILPTFGRYGDVDGNDLELLTPIGGCKGESLKIS